jgi:type I restriction enzyme S subunit
MPVGMIEGLKPCFAIKDSGVPWLGEVPEHWEVWPLKFLATPVTVGIVIQPERLYVAAGVPCLRSLNISSGVIQDRPFVFITVASNQAPRKSHVFAGDIIVVRAGKNEIQ